MVKIIFFDMNGFESIGSRLRGVAADRSALLGAFWNSFYVFEWLTQVSLGKGEEVM